MMKKKSKFHNPNGVQIEAQIEVVLKDRSTQLKLICNVYMVVGF
jgi:hypothetical protein